MKQFKTAAHRGSPAVPNAVDIQFQWDEETLTAHAPSSGQLALLLSNMVDGNFRLESLGALFDFLKGVLDDEDYAVIHADLQQGLDIQLIVELIEALIEEWSVRPTTPAVVSSRSRPTTGRRSTARPAATA
ncbi:MAG: hypothetical protein EHM24_00085 [Acidobacteria bacterium]|nr:MAG: hypothetical protein EHM24_00085 [Acidobacteriota bacterium]